MHLPLHVLPPPSLLFTLFAFVLLLGPLITIHELGHYLVARWCGIDADAFSIGFGPELFGWTDRRGTRWKLSVLPLGGYVRFAGDADAASTPMAADAHPDIPAEKRARWLQNRPLWQRMLVVSAGPLANLLLAVVIFAGFNLGYGHLEAPPVIASFVEPSPARAAGLMIGDRIVAIDGAAIESFEEIPAKVLPVPGETLRITVRRDARNFTVPVVVGTRTLTDEYGNTEHAGLLGISAGHLAIVRVSPLRATTLALHESATMVGMMLTGIRQLVTGARGTADLGGPVKIARYSGERLALGWLAFLDFAAGISINLAFINLLPIPGLDGGHLLLYAAEAVRRRPLPLRGQEWMFRAGLALVLTLMVFVTVNDLIALHVFGR